MNLGVAFKALNDKTRRGILELLRSRDMSAGEIGEQFNISGPSISHHLEILRKAGLVESEKQGQFVIYSLNTTIVDEIVAWLVKLNDK